MKKFFAIALSLLITVTAAAQEDPYANSPAPGPAAETPDLADDAPPITAGIFGLAMVSFAGSEVGYGLGARYQHAIVPGGFLKSVQSIRDELLLEGGIEFHAASYPRYRFNTLNGARIEDSYTLSQLHFSVTAVWELWFTESFAAYPRVGFGFRAIFSDFDIYDPSPFFGVGGAGVIYKLGALALRAEISNLALAAGAGFVF